MKLILFILGIIFVLSPWSSSAMALLVGVALAVTIGNPLPEQTKKWQPKFLSSAVVGMGAGMNLVTVGHVGFSGLGYTILTIGLAFGVGTLLGRILEVEGNTSLLITVGTAICGGSAIAAVSPVVRARSHEISVALGIVFLLNALALFLFPPIGHVLSMTETQFGLWSALAIHDTSSVVGATLQYGPHALEIGTTVKLARALWIVPVTLAVGFAVSRRAGGADAGGGEGGVDGVDGAGVDGGEGGAAGSAAGSIAVGLQAEDVASKVGVDFTNTDRAAAAIAPRQNVANSHPKFPWFIVGFLLAAALVTFVPGLGSAGHLVNLFAQKLLVLTLFLIGTNLSRQNMRAVGVKPFLQGAILWLVMASTTLLAVTQGWIRI